MLTFGVSATFYIGGGSSVGRIISRCRLFGGLRMFLQKTQHLEARRTTKGVAPTQLSPATWPAIADWCAPGITGIAPGPCCRYRKKSTASCGGVSSPGPVLAIGRSSPGIRERGEGQETENYSGERSVVLDVRVWGCHVKFWMVSQSVATPRRAVPREGASRLSQRVAGWTLSVDGLNAGKSGPMGSHEVSESVMDICMSVMLEGSNGYH